MSETAEIMWKSFQGHSVLKFKILLSGVAGRQAYSNCEDVLLNAMLDVGFRFEEIGIVDPEESIFHSAPDEVRKQSQKILRMVQARSEGFPPPIMSQYVMRMGEDFMTNSGRQPGRNPGQGHFDLCTWSSGERLKLVSVSGVNRAADLGLVIHACTSEASDQAEAYFYLPFEMDNNYNVVGQNITCRWKWEELLLFVIQSGYTIFIGDPVVPDASVLGNPPNLTSRYPHTCNYYSASGRRIFDFNFNRKLRESRTAQNGKASNF